MSLKTWFKNLLFSKAKQSDAGDVMQDVVVTKNAINAGKNVVSSVNNGVDVYHQLKDVMADPEAAQQKMGLDKASVEKSEVYQKLSETVAPTDEQAALRSIGLTEENLKLPQEVLAKKMADLMSGKQ